MRLSRRIPGWGVSFLLAALAWPALGRAQQPGTDPTTRAAYEAYVRGTEALSAHQYEAAVQALEESYRLRPSSAALYPLALAHRELGHVRAAIEHFERYLVEEPTFPPGRESAVRDVVRELRARLATVTLRVTPDTYRLSVDDRDAPVVDAAVTLDPGDHTLTVIAAGYVTWRDRVHVAPGQRIERTVTLTRESPPAVASPERSSSITSRWWFWTGAGVLVVGGVLAGVLVARANAEPEPWTPGTFFTVLTLRVP